MFPLKHFFFYLAFTTVVIVGVRDPRSVRQVQAGISGPAWGVEEF